METLSTADNVFSIMFFLLGCCLNESQWKHIGQLVKFFFFNVFLVTFDIVTDFITALNFFNDGHLYWGICTIVPMFAPFVVRFSVSLVELAKVSYREVFYLYTNITNFKLQE